MGTMRIRSRRSGGRVLGRLRSNLWRNNRVRVRVSRRRRRSRGFRNVPRLPVPLAVWLASLLRGFFCLFNFYPYSFSLSDFHTHIATFIFPTPSSCNTQHSHEFTTPLIPSRPSTVSHLHTISHLPCIRRVSTHMHMMTMTSIYLLT